MYTYTKMVKKCYKKNKERLQKQSCGRYQYLSEEKKEKKEKKAQHRYKNLSEEEQIKSQYHYDQMGSIK